MKKFLLFCVFAFSAFMPFTVKASYLPPVLPNTSVVPDFLQTVAQYEIVNDTNTYLPQTDLNAVNRVVNGRSIQDSLQYTYLDNATLSAELGTIYTIDGVEVGQSNTYTVYGTSDIGNFMCICDKFTGEILYQGDANTLHSTLIGGQGLKETFPEFVVRELTGAGNTLNNVQRVLDAVNDAKAESMIIYGNSLTSSDKEFLSDYRFYFRMNTNLGWSVYVPNACSNNVLVVEDSLKSFTGNVAEGNPDQLQPVIFANDPSQVYFSGTGSYVGLRSENVTYWGHTFHYVSPYRNSYQVLYEGGYLDMNLPTQQEYTQYKDISDDAYYLTPVEDVDNEPVNNIYNYTYVTENPPITNRYVNNNYNYEGDTNYNNYPIYYNYDYPSYPVTNTYATNIYNYYNTPQQGESIGSITDPILPENIPILSNLEKRFPFSIPFDMYKMLKGLAVPRETPVIDVSFTIPRANIEWDIYYDLAPFDDTAHLFRILFLISYIIGLAYFSYDHFFGN